MNISEIKTAEPFTKIFPITTTVLTSLIMDMKRNGYDAAHPIIVWQGKNIVVDGHTRLEAAKLVGLEDIHVAEREFRDEDEAVDYAIHSQRDRRNLTDAEIMHLVELLDKRRERGGDHTSEKAKASHEAIAPSVKSAEQTAKVVGISRAKVEKVRAIKAKAAPEVKKAVEAGEISINAGYQTTRKKSQPAVAVPVSNGMQRSDDLLKVWKNSGKHERERFLHYIDEHPKDLLKTNIGDVLQFEKNMRKILNRLDEYARHEFENRIVYIASEVTKKRQVRDGGGKAGNQ